MTTDEKIDRLTERTDAVTQSVELLVSLHRDSEAKAEARAAKLEGHTERLVGLFEKMVDAITNHEGRLRRLEGE